MFGTTILQPSSAAGSSYHEGRPHSSSTRKLTTFIPYPSSVHAEDSHLSLVDVHPHPQKDSSCGPSSTTHYFAFAEDGGATAAGGDSWSVRPQRPSSSQSAPGGEKGYVIASDPARQGRASGSAIGTPLPSRRPQQQNHSRRISTEAPLPSLRQTVLAHFTTLQLCSAACKQESIPLRSRTGESPYLGPALGRKKTAKEGMSVLRRPASSGAAVARRKGDLKHCSPPPSPATDAQQHTESSKGTSPQYATERIAGSRPDTRLQHDSELQQPQRHAHPCNNQKAYQEAHALLCPVCLHRAADDMVHESQALHGLEGRHRQVLTEQQTQDRSELYQVMKGEWLALCRRRAAVVSRALCDDLAVPLLEEERSQRKECMRDLWRSLRSLHVACIDGLIMKGQESVPGRRALRRLFRAACENNENTSASAEQDDEEDEESVPGGDRKKQKNMNSGSTLSSPARPSSPNRTDNNNNGNKGDRINHEPSTRPSSRDTYIVQPVKDTQQEIQEPSCPAVDRRRRPSTTSGFATKLFRTLCIQRGGGWGASDPHAPHVEPLRSSPIKRRLEKDESFVHGSSWGHSPRQQQQASRLVAANTPRGPSSPSSSPATGSTKTGPRATTAQQPRPQHPSQQLDHSRTSHPAVGGIRSSTSSSSLIDVRCLFYHPLDAALDVLQTEEFCRRVALAEEEATEAVTFLLQAKNSASLCKVDALNRRHRKDADERRAFVSDDSQWSLSRLVVFCEEGTERHTLYKLFQERMAAIKQELAMQKRSRLQQKETATRQEKLMAEGLEWVFLAGKRWVDEHALHVAAAVALRMDEEPSWQEAMAADVGGAEQMEREVSFSREACTRQLVEQICDRAVDEA